jgi:S-adenosylmethionine:tRNA ribosyltransferase-isomerase
MEPFLEAISGETVELPAGGQAKLLAPYQHQHTHDTAGRSRLWLATLKLPLPLSDYLAAYGFPIRYGYVREQWPLSYYQTIYATEAGSAEMPSAGRAFTADVITRLITKGIQVVPLILHTGVASLEEHEPPYEEFYRVPAVTAQTVNQARAAGKRVVAVGTTVVRALETVAGEEGVVHPGEGYTNLVITPQRHLRAVDSMLTGFHEPQATHLAMLEALAGLDHLCLTYHEALREGYLWHEFGDLHLLLS